MIARQPRFVVAVLAATAGYGVMNLLMVATPLSMLGNQLDFAATAFVIRWHVLAMFVPSFSIGDLIRRFGLSSIIATGVLLTGACVLINFSGTSVWHYWASLLSLGWTFINLSVLPILVLVLVGLRWVRFSDAQGTVAVEPAKY